MSGGFKNAISHLITQFVCGGSGETNGRVVHRLGILLGQLWGEDLVGGLDLTLQVLQQGVHAVLGNGLPMPVFQILNACIKETQDFIKERVTKPNSIQKSTN